MKGPGTSSRGDFQVGFVTAIEQLGAGLAILSLVKDLDSRVPMPLHPHDGDFLLRENAPDFDSWLQVIKVCHGPDPQSMFRLW